MWTRPFPGRRCSPQDPRGRARVNQILSILDSYAYRTLVWDILVERVRAAENGRATDEARIAAALPRAETCLGALEALMDVAPWLAGPQLTLADLHAAPIFAYACWRRRVAALLARHDGIRRWWEKMAARREHGRHALAAEQAAQ